MKKTPIDQNTKQMSYVILSSAHVMIQYNNFFLLHKWHRKCSSVSIISCILTYSLLCIELFHHVDNMTRHIAKTEICIQKENVAHFHLLHEIHFKANKKKRLEAKNSDLNSILHDCVMGYLKSTLSVVQNRIRKRHHSYQRIQERKMCNKG